MVVYLCGPIQDCTDSECKDWRIAATAKFPHSLDPMRRDYRAPCQSPIREQYSLEI